MEPEEFCADVLVGRSARGSVSVGANFRFGHGAARRRGVAARARRSSRPTVVPLVEHGGRAGLVEPDPGAGRRRRRGRRRRTLLGAPFRLEGDGGAGRRARPRARHADGEPRARAGCASCRRPASTPATARVDGRGGPGRGQHRRAPDVRGRRRAAGRGPPDRTSRAICTGSRCGSTFLERLRDEVQVRLGRGAGRADAEGRRADASGSPAPVAGPCAVAATFFAVTLTKEAKTEVIRKFATHEGDTGSPEVQVALLTARINELTEHLREHRRTTTRGAAC